MVDAISPENDHPSSKVYADLELSADRELRLALDGYTEIYSIWGDRVGRGSALRRGSPDFFEKLFRAALVRHESNDFLAC